MTSPCPDNFPSREVADVIERYAKRGQPGTDSRYSMLKPDVWQAAQERQRRLIEFLSRYVSAPVSELTVLEVGCGTGANLLELIHLGFNPERLIGNELQPARSMLARRNLPAACEVIEGDAAVLEFPAASFDIVYQSTVFTSLLNVDFQRMLAQRMWEWVKPGGGVLWYDFTYDNPRNPDVRGVTLRRVRELFPQGRLDCKRATLAPPISRRVCRLHPMAYHLFNVLPFLRTHVLCWISKPQHA